MAPTGTRLDAPGSVPAALLDAPAARTALTEDTGGWDGSGARPAVPVLCQGVVVCHYAISAVGTTRPA